MILTALNNYYARLTEQGNDDIPPYGFSPEKISYALVISPDGELVDVRGLLDTSAKKPRPSVYLVPNAPKRSVNIAPCFLWDKSGYVLGLIAAEKGKAKEKDLERALKTHQAFKEYHREWIGDSNDEGLMAVLAFLDRWNPQQEQPHPLISDEMLDTNLVFQLDGEKGFIHERPAAKEIRSRQLSNSAAKEETCLVTGEMAPVAELHPSIKGVNGAQSSGASLVSFNQDSFTSYHHEKGMNAPVSEKATFAYSTALNHLLRNDDKNRQRVNIGDTTVVFWAEADTEQQAQASENLLSSLFTGSPAPKQDSKKTEVDSDRAETSKLNSAFAQIAQGRPLEELGTDLKPDTKIYVLGLAPNAARLSVRFWESNTLDQFARRLAQHYQDMLMDPRPWKNEPSIWRLINETVPHRKGAKPKQDDASPQLAGELARAILTGQRYPQSLLANLIMRFRADGDISSLRVALCKAVLVRNLRINKPNEYDKELFMGLDRTNTSPGYLLGRLFCVLESAQKNAADSDLNSTIKDRFYGSASSTPMSVFQSLLRNSSNHLSKMKKQESKRGLAFYFESEMDEIMYKLDGTIAKNLPLEEQVKFAIGYHHQRYHKSQESKPTETETTTEGDA